MEINVSKNGSHHSAYTVIQHDFLSTNSYGKSGLKFTWTHFPQLVDKKWFGAWKIIWIDVDAGATSQHIYLDYNENRPAF